jgi:hypothetical protein
MMEQICEIMPIIEKAAPFIASLIKDNKLSIIVGLLGLLVNCNPNNHDEIASKLKADDDLYAKLKNLESTHGEWLKSLNY